MTQAETMFRTLLPADSTILTSPTHGRAHVAPEWNQNFRQHLRETFNRPRKRPNCLTQSGIEATFPYPRRPIAGFTASSAIRDPKSFPLAAQSALPPI
jgi:hypothetical protein